jgi:Flp pilus assembly protein TadG
MHNLSIARRLAGTARRFLRADNGNIAVIFVIALLPILGFMGAAIDYSRANKARSAMQGAMDAAALMVSRDLSNGTVLAADVPAQARTYFNGLYTDKDALVLTFSAAYTIANGTLGSTVQITGTGQITTDFMNLAGFPTMAFGTNSTAAWGNTRLRVAMALDNTGSMKDDGKMTALQNAAAGTNGLIDQISKLAKNPGDVYISLIPFAKVVNVGTSNSGQNWIDWTDWLNPPTQQPNNGSTQATLPPNWQAIGPGAVCPFTNASGGFVCTTGPVNGSSTSTSLGKNVIPSLPSTYSGYICPSVDANSHSYYNGCWDSEPASAILGEKFCSGSSSCTCPLTSLGLPVGGCLCLGTGSATSCTGITYVHNWTQPGVVAKVGYPSRLWTAAAPTPSVANAWTATSTNPISTWTGCVADRTQPYDTTGAAPTTDVTTEFPANQYIENSISYCSSSATTQLAPIIPPSYAWATLKTAINAMAPTGGTNQAIGLAWAWQALVPGGPLNVPVEDPNYIYNRAIILLSDGLNTEDRWPDNGNGATQNANGAIDARQALLCQNLKAAKDPKTNGVMYTIYTIQVNTGRPADPTSAVLQNCATDSTKFYQLTSSTQIVSAFNNIANDLAKLHVAR